MMTVGGGITRAESHLSTARKLFKIVEPPLIIKREQVSNIGNFLVTIKIL